MRFLFLIVAFAMFFSVQALSEEQKEALRGRSKECVKETGVESELVQKWKHNDYSTEDDKLKQYIYCMMHKTGIMSEDGKFHKDVAVNKVKEEDVKEKVAHAIDQCLDQQDSDKYESAWKLAKCYVHVRPDHDIF